MLPPAPARLSTTTFHLFMSLSFCATTRAMMSVPPEGGKGTMSLIGLVGYSCAAAAAATSDKARMETRRRSIGVPWLLGGQTTWKWSVHLDGDRPLGWGQTTYRGTDHNSRCSRLASGLPEDETMRLVAAAVVAAIACSAWAQSAP